MGLISAAAAATPPAQAIFECNTPNAVGTGLAVWDTVYKPTASATWTDQSGVVPPELGLDLTGSGTTIECIEAGFFLVNWEIDLTAAPGNAGSLVAGGADFLTGLTVDLLASGNPAYYFASRLYCLFPGDVLSLAPSGTGGDVLFTYAVAQVTRIGNFA